MANLTKHYLMISPKEPKALSGSRAMSLNACWSRPIAVLDGKERQALRIRVALKSRFLAHSWASATCLIRRSRILLVSLSKPILVLIAPLTFPFFGIVLGHTLRVGREVALVVTDDQRQIRECIFFPTPSVGWACASFQRLA